MPRPVKCRKVSGTPKECFFKPAGVPIRELEEISLLVEELEAIKLKDLESLQQEECAQRMGISRPTFQRILTEARQKVADALVNGKAIRVDGGNFAVKERPIHCRHCNHHWQATQHQSECPQCGGGK